MGAWTRLEGTPCDPNPNKPFAKMDNVPLFNNDGKLNPSITILGKEANLEAIARFFIVTCTVLPLYHTVDAYLILQSMNYERFDHWKRQLTRSIGGS